MIQINGILSATIGSTSSGGPADASNPTNASTSMQGGQAVFENDNYRITADDNNTVTINNKSSGETYQAWGDPHMKVDGAQAFDFWGTTTFSLEDGTKVTIDTTPASGDADATLSSRVTITNGDYGVRINGVDSNRHGDLSIDEAKGHGKILDVVTSDGNRLQENPAGKGFVAVDGNGQIRRVDQAFINATDEKKSGHLQDRHKDAFNQLSSLVQIAFEGAFSNNSGERRSAENPRDPVGDGHARSLSRRHCHGADTSLFNGGNAFQAPLRGAAHEGGQRACDGFTLPLPSAQAQKAQVDLFQARIELTMSRL